MKIKLDENLSLHFKDPLLQLGHEASTAFEEGLLGKVDTDVGAAAKGEGRMIFTLWILILRTFVNFRRERILELFCSDRAAWGRWPLTNLY